MAGGDYGAFIESWTGEAFPAGDFLDREGRAAGRRRGERVLAPTRRGESKSSMAIQFSSSTRISRTKRALSGPTVTVLADMSFGDAVVGGGTIVEAGTEKENGHEL